MVAISPTALSRSFCLVEGVTKIKPDGSPWRRFNDAIQQDHCTFQVFVPNGKIGQSQHESNFFGARHHLPFEKVLADRFGLTFAGHLQPQEEKIFCQVTVASWEVSAAGVNNNNETISILIMQARFEASPGRKSSHLDLRAD